MLDMLRFKATRAILILGLLFHTAALASDWTDLFVQSFNRVYEESRCQQNVLRFLELGRREGLDLKKIQVVEVINHGISNFGMVGAKSNRMNRDSNWFHHVFVLSGNRVLDFDFTSGPKNPEFLAYLRQMFTTPRMLETQKKCLSEIGNYEFTFYSAAEYHAKHWARSVSAIRSQATRVKDSTAWGCGVLIQSVRPNL